MRKCDKMRIENSKVKDQERNDEPMTIATYNKQHNQYIEGMKNYINTLETMNPADAKKEAKESLIRSGVLTKKGTLKKNIVSK